MIITDIICDFDTTCGSIFRALIIYSLADFLLLYTDQKAIKAFDPAKKVSKYISHDYRGESC